MYSSRCERIKGSDKRAGSGTVEVMSRPMQRAYIETERKDEENESR